MKRLMIMLVLLDNALAHFIKSWFPKKWKITGKCRQCGNCCREIYLKITPAQLQSPLFTNLAIRWISWLFDFNLLRIDYENHYLIFNCQHLTSEGKCNHYFWRPNICRNYPLVDYFEKPKLLPGCGFKAELNHS